MRGISGRGTPSKAQRARLPALPRCLKESLLRLDVHTGGTGPGRSALPPCSCTYSQSPIQGYDVFGLVQEDEAIVYREWAPAAKALHLIGWAVLLLGNLDTVSTQWVMRVPAGND